MPDREALAARAAELFNANPGAMSYQEAIGQAMAELNPTADPEAAQVIIRALLNVPDEPPVPARHRTPLRSRE